MNIPISENGGADGRVSAAPEGNDTSEPKTTTRTAAETKKPSASQSQPEDAKLETRLTTKDLEALQGAFNFNGDSYERLCLNRDQFVQALSIILNKGTEYEYAELFDKIDISKQGSVSWDQLAQHMLLQFYEKDDKVKSTQLPQWRDLRLLSLPHKDVIQRVDMLRSNSKYVCVSREGSITMVNSELELQRCMRAGSDACRQRDLWVTDFALLHSLNKIAVAFTSKEIAFYDISSKSDFTCQSRVENLDASPLCLDFWHSEENTNDAVLCWGDINGNINAIFFLSASINLFERQSGPSDDKQETTLVVKLKDIKSGKFTNSNRFISHKAHSDWVRQVRYINALECFISCATTWDDSIAIGWIEKRTTLASQTMSVKKSPIHTEVRNVQRVSTFQVHQGVNAFDFHESLNLVATAGANNHVCLWNPYVVSKPNGVLTGHVAPVIQVLFNTSKGHVLSFSKDKVLRIWDVQLQVCLQRLAGIFPKGPEVTTRIFLHEDTGRLFLTFNHSLTLLEMKAEVKNKILSHERPVTAVIFNAGLNQVLTACQGSTLTVWLIDSGQRLRSTQNAHGTAEITCLANDATEPRFYSGGTDGFVRIWDWNGHMYHELDCNKQGITAEVSQILVLKHGIIAAGFSKDITVFRTASFRSERVSPDEWNETDQHKDDILAVAFLSPHHLITASYDGAIAVWNINSEICTRQLTERCWQSGKSGGSSRRSSLAGSRPASAKCGQDASSNFTISRLRILGDRKAKAQNCANLVSCGANGFVRFWNFNHGNLVAEFIAHKQASSIIMDVSPNGNNLVTADGNGFVKVWNIGEYCDGGEEFDGIVTEPPELSSEWQAHTDQINDLEFAVKEDRLLIISVSSDFSASVWDVMGNKIGTFGQEEHWKIESLEIILERIQRMRESRSAKTASSSSNTLRSAATSRHASRIEFDEENETEVVEQQRPLSVLTDRWEPDDRAVTDPKGFRISAWDRSLLGSRYKELGSQKRQRKQPNVIDNLPFLAYDRHTPTMGPYSNLDISNFAETRDPKQPDFMKNPDSYFRDKDNVILGGDKMPVLAETLKAAFDDRSLFPKYILDYESQMKKYQNYTTATGNSNNNNNNYSRDTDSKMAGSQSGHATAAAAATATAAAARKDGRLSRKQ